MPQSLSNLSGKPGQLHFDLVYNSLPIIQATAYQDVRDPNPAEVTFEHDAAMDDAALGEVHDSAYWASNLELASGASSGTVDATALPLASKLPSLRSHLTGTFVNLTTGGNAYLDWQVWNRNLQRHGLQDFQPGWTPGPDVRVTTTAVARPAHAGSNAFDLTTHGGLAASNLDLDRMSISPASSITGYLDVAAPLRLALCSTSLTDRSVSLDGAATAASFTAPCLTVNVPAGRHTLVVGTTTVVTPVVALAGGSQRAGAAVVSSAAAARATIAAPARITVRPAGARGALQVAAFLAILTVVGCIAARRRRSATRSG